MMEIKQVFLKTRAEFGKQCIFDTCGPHMDEEIRPNPEAMANYIMRTHCNTGVQRTKQFALHEKREDERKWSCVNVYDHIPCDIVVFHDIVPAIIPPEFQAQTVGVQTKNSGMFHFEGGWPKEINPKDEETTTRFRRRVEKDEAWAPRLRYLFRQMEHNILQNDALNIYENYFDDMIPTELTRPRVLRTVNVYEDPQTPARPVNDISWSPDSGSKIVVSYCFLEFGTAPDYSNIVYIWQIDNPTKPWMTLEASSAAVVSEFNPRDPSVLASGLMSGQVCSWDVRTGATPVQTSHRQFSHRDCATAVKWMTTKSNTEFFSGSTDGRAMWWDTRKLRGPIETLVFDLQAPNEARMDRAIGVSSANFEPSVSTKFMFGLENGVVISGLKKARTPAEKLALRFNAHHGPVVAVDRNGFNPKIFLTVGDRTARIWAEDTRDGSLVSTRFIRSGPVGGCWNKARHSMFYVTTRTGVLTAWDLLVGLSDPILTVQLCEQKLTAIAAHEAGALLAVGSSAGNVYLVDSTEALYSFDKNDRSEFASYLERCSRFVKAIDARLKEMKLTGTYVEEVAEPTLEDLKARKKDKPKIDKRKRQEAQEKLKEHREKSRIVHRDRRRLKDEFPELRKAEERFFEIVEKEKQKYEDDVTLSPERLTPSVRRLISRKIEKSLTDEAKHMKTKTPPKKVSPKKTRAKKIKTAISTTKMAQDVEQEKAMTEESLLPLAETIVESPAEKISKGKRRKMAPKKRLMPVAFRLPRPCKVSVCKPDICCRRTASVKLNARSADRAVEVRAKWIRDEVAEGTRSRDDAGGWRPPVESKERTRRRKRESWTRLLRAHKREGTVDKYSEREGIRFLPEMMAPLDELTEDVRRAKREIQEARRSGRGRMRTRKLAGEASKRDAARAAAESRETSRESEKDGEDPTEEIVSSTRILAARKGRKLRRVAAVTNPCAPWEPPALAKDLRALLGDPLPESIEKKASPGMAYFEEIEAARGRVYPRISDFHSIE